VPAAEGDDFWRYGAVWLFVLRSRASGAHVTEDRDGAAFIAAICRRLDGIPLAIELAAARVAMFGLQEIAARLDDRFHLLTGGRRTALPRQQTLRATLDWSYQLLTPPERIILRRLAIFAGAFGLEAASAVVSSSDLKPSEVADGLVNLVAKSLVAAEVDGTITRYRLLDTTRAYALEKLVECGEYGPVARRLAEYGRDVLERAETRFERRPSEQQAADYRLIDNLRTALDWAFSPDGDASIGVALTTAAVPLWMHLSLLDECRSRVERALAALAVAADRDPRREMKLQAALGGSLVFAGATHNSKVVAAWTKALESAETLDDAEYRLLALWGLWYFHGAGSRHRIALGFAEKFHSLAANPPVFDDRLVGERMIAISQHHLGNHSDARHRLERALAEYTAPDRSSPVIWFHPKVSAHVYLAWILWLQGFPDQAMRAAKSSVEEARAADHELFLGFSLGLAICPIALLVGDLATAKACLGMLLDQSRMLSWALWGALGRSYQGVLLIKRGDADVGLPLLRAGYDEVGEGRFAYRLTAFLDALIAGEALDRTGQIGDGLALVEHAIERCERAEEHWVLPELLRVKGELLRSQGESSAAMTAEDQFRQSLDLARRQGALAWELRAATSLARLLRVQGPPADAVALLQPVYDRFTEGFDTADLKAAKVLLDALQ
jgi:predicted ATPase